MEGRTQESRERQLVERIKKHDVISVVGLSKNVGKTTVVNFILRRLEKACVITVGMDGENEDKIFKNTKPPIFLPQGNFAVVPSQITPYGVRIIETFETPSGTLSLVEALVDVEVQTMRMGSYEETSQMIEKIKKYADKVIVDGALARIGAISISDATILVTGAQIGKDVNEVVEKTVEYVNRILTPQAPEWMLKVIERNPTQALIWKKDRALRIKVNGVAGYEDEIVQACEDADFVYLPGAVNEEIASHVKCPIIVPSGDRIFSKVGKFFAVKNVQLIGIAVNHTSVEGNELDLDELIFELKRRLNSGIIVFDVLYDHDL